ncbi:hypothetical protein E2C01_095441 [Portunus trituberculatus]|uniref:Uncharacterized protein n=1 Tax=Portunus trituberculatus TaxID=210409 RepID=A0A5B7K5S5_PORTR|nr:hypothetical protein [Portunus trituberculatus]
MNIYRIEKFHICISPLLFLLHRAFSSLQQARYLFMGSQLGRFSPAWKDIGVLCFTLRGGMPNEEQWDEEGRQGMMNRPEREERQDTGQ